MWCENALHIYITAKLRIFEQFYRIFQILKIRHILRTFALEKRKRPFSGVWTYSPSTEIKETRSAVFTSMLTYRREVKSKSRFYSRGGSPLDAGTLALDTNLLPKILYLLILRKASSTPQQDINHESNPLDCLFFHKGTGRNQLIVPANYPITMPKLFDPRRRLLFLAIRPHHKFLRSLLLLWLLSHQITSLNNMDSLTK